MADEDFGLSLSDLILDLSSTRADGIPAGKRYEQIQVVSQSLEATASDRRALADLEGP